MSLNIIKKRALLISVIIFSIIFIIPGSLKAQTYDKPGNSACPFLKMAPTPRGEALGAASIAIVDDAGAVFSNPAGLMNITNSDIEVGRTNMPAGIGLSYFSFAKKFGHHAIAISMLSFATDDMKVRTVLQPEGTGEEFYSGQHAYGLTYARNYTDKFKVGFTAKLLSLNIVSGMYDEVSWCGDIGLQYHSDLPGLLTGTIIAVSIRNFGPQITYVSEGYGLPLLYTIGAARPIENIFSDNDKLFVAVNWNKSVDEQEKAQIGLEYNYSNIISLRTGYKFNSGEQSITFGTGFMTKVLERQLRINYSYTPFGMIGDIQKFSLGFSL